MPFLRALLVPLLFWATPTFGAAVDEPPKEEWILIIQECENMPQGLIDAIERRVVPMQRRCRWRADMILYSDDECQAYEPENSIRASQKWVYTQRRCVRASDLTRVRP